MALPLAALRIAKAGRKVYKKVTGQKKLTKGQQQVKKATNSQRVTKNTKNKGRAQGAAAGVAGSAVAGNTVKTANANNKNKSEFEKAFSAAHNAGKKTFTFKGKSYTTKVKKGK